MNPNNLQSILDLINKGIQIGGEVVPIALKAYSALKAESGMTDQELLASAKALNAEDAAKLQALLAE